jgi:hypothetical protein
MKKFYPAFHRRYPVCLLVLLLSCLSKAQSPITSIVTSSSTATVVSYSNYKGAGLRDASNALISNWDSLSSSYTVNFNAPSAANILSLTQFSVPGIGTTILKMPVSAIVKLRRLANSDVGDARVYYNFWAAYSSMPNPGDLNGTFNFTASEVLAPEDAFLTNNLLSGYDNIFQNTIASPHFGNIERVDFLIPAGLKPYSDSDRIQSGTVVIDRGIGDPFKIAVITAVNGSNDPIAYGPMISVTAANFGDTLLSSRINYGILINDVKYNAQSRPSTRQSQNLKGVFISLKDLGVAINQTFYGYSLFGNDVASANPDWTTYPNNSNAASQLDPVNVMGLFKTTHSVLSVPLRFTAVKKDDAASLRFTIYNKASSDHVVIERSTDGKNFEQIGSVATDASGEYIFPDPSPSNGNNFYRLQLADRDGSKGYSEIRMLQFEKSRQVHIFPNPATDVAHIQFPENWTQKNIMVQLYNYAGEMVQENSFVHTSSVQTISVKNLARGIYQMRLINSKEDLISTRSLIVSN